MFIFNSRSIKSNSRNSMAFSFDFEIDFHVINITDNRHWTRFITNIILQSISNPWWWIIGKQTRKWSLLQQNCRFVDSTIASSYSLSDIFLEGITLPKFRTVCTDCQLSRQESTKNEIGQRLLTVKSMNNRNESPMRRKSPNTSWRQIFSNKFYFCFQESWHLQYWTTSFNWILNKIMLHRRYFHFRKWNHNWKMPFWNWQRNPCL